MDLVRNSEHIDVGTGKTIITRGKEILIIDPVSGGTYFTKETKKAVSKYVRKIVSKEGGIPF